VSAFPPLRALPGFELPHQFGKGEHVLDRSDQVQAIIVVAQLLLNKGRKTEPFGSVEKVRAE
jgi:hypothetical protein